jgi:hypothetical protein
MVALAQSPPGGSSARSLQKKTTVMLVQVMAHMHGEVPLVLTSQPDPDS